MTQTFLNYFCDTMSFLSFLIHMSTNTGVLMSMVCIYATVTIQAQPSYYDAGKTACIPGGGHDHYPFCDRNLTIDERVKDLINRIPNSSKANMLTARGRGMNKGREGFPNLGVPSYYWGSNW